ncbi:alkaline phosphatase [Paraneptunicella aestuarii]|uniref:alkaline phosphatase n=1 Tax=Paraneptunicella aestuarii TaxID=2831148 RepID=UPI001E44B945|nr:alkaline phosphatase [Paraneptunicella aestuarii]UAA40087.1 alkaline phosphatase [Paraneptunicella aestuarii]
MKQFIYTAIAASVLSLTGCMSDGDDGANGADGAQGSAGINSLVAQTSLSVGSEHCANGGVQIDSGLDANRNNVLDADEISATEYVCTPAATELSSAQLQSSTNNPWFVSGRAEITEAKAQWNAVTVGNVDAAKGETTSSLQIAQVNASQLADMRGKAKNVILFVGDGMGISTVTAARIMDGQDKGMMGEENVLSFGDFPFSGFSKTYNVDAQTPDSAGTMSAMMSGVKTDAGIIGIAEAVERGNCASSQGQELVTALELAEIAGKATGIISTARITHATPAATYAKSADRNWEDVSDMPASQVAAGCKDIADQLVNFESNLEARYSGLDVDGIEVVMGGGRRHFLPKDPAFNSPDAVSSTEGDRTDGRDLTAEWKAAYPNGNYVYDQTGFDAINAATAERVFGLFNESHMQYEADRANDIAGEPSLTEMTSKAIDILKKDEDGFFLMVESGRIDHGHHAGSAYNALTDAVEFAKAVQAAASKTSAEDTLIIVTADHSHVFTIAGYPKRGNPILGKVVPIGSDEPSMAADNMPYTTLGYTNGLGFKDLGNETDAEASYNYSAVTGRVDLSNVDTTASGYHQEALVPLGSETHAGEDVGIYAKGPGANLVTGTNEQSVIFHVMDYAADLVNKANAALN